MITPETVIRQRIRGSSYRKLAVELGVSPGYLNHVARGIQPPGEALLDALGLEKTIRVTYRRKRNGKVTA